MALRSSGIGSLARSVNNGSYHMVAETISVLRIDSSMRQRGSVSRDLAAVAVSKLRAELAVSDIVLRDLKSGVGHVNSAWRDASLGSAAA